MKETNMSAVAKQTLRTVRSICEDKHSVVNMKVMNNLLSDHVVQGV